jgi:hypothetical protein
MPRRVASSLASTFVGMIRLARLGP